MYAIRSYYVRRWLQLTLGAPYVAKAVLLADLHAVDEQERDEKRENRVRFDHDGHEHRFALLFRLLGDEVDSYNFV